MTLTPKVAEKNFHSFFKSQFKHPGKYNFYIEEQNLKIKKIEQQLTNQAHPSAVMSLAIRSIEILFSEAGFDFLKTRFKERPEKPVSRLDKILDSFEQLSQKCDEQQKEVLTKAQAIFYPQLEGWIKDLFERNTEYAPYFLGKDKKIISKNQQTGKSQPLVTYRMIEVCDAILKRGRVTDGELIQKAREWFEFLGKTEIS